MIKMKKKFENEIFTKIVKEFDENVLLRMPEAIKDLQDNLDFNFSYKNIEFQLVPLEQISQWRDSFTKTIKKVIQLTLEAREKEILEIIDEWANDKRKGDFAFLNKNNLIELKQKIKREK